MGPVYTCQFIRSLLQQKSNLRSLQRGGYKASPSLQPRVELELRAQVLQREGVWRFDRMKDHDSQHRPSRQRRSQALSVRGRPKEVTIDRCGMLIAMLSTPSEDRCPRSSASRDGFSTLRANTQHRTNSSIRCNVSHAKHTFPMRHKNKSI